MLRTVPCVLWYRYAARVPREHRRVPSALVPLEHPNAYPVVLCARLVAAVHAHRQAQRQVGHGLLGLPNRNGMAKLTKPGEWAHRHILGVQAGPSVRFEGRRASGKKRSRRWARQVRIEKPRVKRVGTGRQARSKRPHRACDVCTETCKGAARRAWQRSVRWRAGHGMATKPPRPAWLCT
jgi:hypothetical protein